MAKLRVAWMVAGCAPGVRTITRSILFHCTTWLTGCVAWAIAGARFAVVSAATVAPANNNVFISDLTQVDASVSTSLSTRLGSMPAASSDRRSSSTGKLAAAVSMQTATPLVLFRAALHDCGRKPAFSSPSAPGKTQQEACCYVRERAITKILQPPIDQRSSGRFTCATSITNPTIALLGIKHQIAESYWPRHRRPPAHDIVRGVVSVRPFDPPLAGSALSAIEIVALSSEA